MPERGAYEDLLKWKAASHQKALLVDGARQVGKTYLVEEFARREYPHYIKIDFLRDDAAARALASAQDANEVIEANVQTERRCGGTVYYLPLYMLPFIAEEARGTEPTLTAFETPDWDSLLLQ